MLKTQKLFSDEFGLNTNVVIYHIYLDELKTTLFGLRIHAINIMHIQFHPHFLYYWM